MRMAHRHMRMHLISNNCIRDNSRHHWHYDRGNIPRAGIGIEGRPLGAKDKMCLTE